MFQGNSTRFACFCLYSFLFISNLSWLHGKLNLFVGRKIRWSLVGVRFLIILSNGSWVLGFVLVVLFFYSRKKVLLKTKNVFVSTIKVFFFKYVCCKYFFFHLCTSINHSLTCAVSVGFVLDNWIGLWFCVIFFSY